MPQNLGTRTSFSPNRLNGRGRGLCGRTPLAWSSTSTLARSDAVVRCIPPNLHIALDSMRLGPRIPSLSAAHEWVRNGRHPHRAWPKVTTIIQQALAVGFACSHRGLCSLTISPDAVCSPPPRKILRSSFVSDGKLSTQTPQPISVTEVRFKKTTCLVADDSGVPTLLEESSVITGFLGLKTLELSAGERGSSKDVFAVHLLCLVRIKSPYETHPSASGCR